MKRLLPECPLHLVSHHDIAEEVLSRAKEPSTVDKAECLQSFPIIVKQIYDDINELLRQCGHAHELWRR